jgi:hypothetical protein
MRQELVDILDRSSAVLTAEIDPENGLFTRLLSSGVLTTEQVERCRAKETPADKVEEVLRCLRRRPDSCFQGFCDVLRQLGRSDLIPPNLPDIVNPPING